MKVNTVLVFILSNEFMKQSSKIFSEMKKISGHEKSFLCMPAKSQWKRFFADEEKDESELHWTKPHAISLFEIIEGNEDVLEKINSIEGVQVFQKNIENKLKVMSSWQKF